ncbi:MAG: RNA polymerase sigma factor [Chitinophagales bacterium]|nr:RNA polymerase sigma factor [Chitinophagales bacterium]
MNTLDEIIEGCIAQKRVAQKLLYERYYGKMMAVCQRYANDKQDASLILNNGFLKIFTHLEAFKKSNNPNFNGWAHRIMVNSAIDFYRSAIKNSTKEISAHLTISNNEDSFSQLAAEEIIALIQQLSPAYRAVFNLYVMEGYNHSEIAQMLGIAEGTSKSNLSKARVQLQNMLEKQQRINVTPHFTNAKTIQK